MRNRYENRLFILRKKQQKSQSEVIKAVNITQKTLYNYERGFSPIPSDKLIEFAKFYGCSTDYILCFNDEEQSKNE